MASHLYRSRTLLQFPRYAPALIARAQASQNAPPTPGSGVPMSGSTKTVAQTGGTKKGDSSVLPKSSTSKDHTNPTKTSSDAPALDHESVDKKEGQTGKAGSSSSSSGSKAPSSSSPEEKRSFMNTPAGQFITGAALTMILYTGYKMISGESKKGLQSNDHYKRATADYQAANAQGTDVKQK